MPINPFRPLTNYDIPTPFAPQGRLDPSVFSNIANLGESIGRAREQSQLADIARSAVDPTTGALDVNKFATAAAVAGHDPTRLLTLIEAQRGRSTAEAAQRALEAYHTRTATEAERANRENERLRQLQLDQPQQQFVPGTLMPPPYVIQMPKKAGEPPIYQPVTPPPAATPGPQTALP